MAMANFQRYGVMALLAVIFALGAFLSLLPGTCILTEDPLFEWRYYLSTCYSGCQAMQKRMILEFTGLSLMLILQ